MARKQKFDGGTANEIARVAVKEFFEKGFDGTSMRSIADAAGCEAGLIYYYYKTKDDLFSTVLDNFSARIGSTPKPSWTELHRTHTKRYMRFSDI